MGLLRNRPVEDGQPQSSVPQLPANDQIVIEPRATGAPHPSNASRSLGEGTLGVSTAPEIPLEELRRLAQTRGANDRTSTGMRGKILLFAAAMIVVSGIVAWHHYGQAAMATLSSASVAPALVSSRPAVTESSSDIAAGDPTAPEAIAPQPAQQAVAIQPAQQMTPPGAAPEVLQQLEAVSRELVVVHQALQQMASKQDDMARNIAALQASNDDLKKKLAPPRLTGATPVQPRKPSLTAAPAQTVGQLSLPPPPIADAPPSAGNRSVPDPRWPGVSRPPSGIRDN